MSGSIDQQPHNCCKRLRKPETWKRTIAKKERDHGRAYISPSTKKLVEERKMGPKCTCPNKCFDKVGIENARTIFENFWALGNHSSQTQYIGNCVTVTNIKRSSVKDKESRRSVTNIYRIFVNNSPIKICLSAFLKIHGISEKRVRNAIKVTHTRTVVEDLRGCNLPVNKTKPEVRELILAHIRSLPIHASQYLYSKTPIRAYLPPGSSMKILYRDYVSCLERDNQQQYKGSEHTYFNIFKTVFNNSNGPTRTETSNFYNTFHIEVKEVYNEHNKNHMLEPKLQEQLYIVNGILTRDYIKSQKDSKNPTQKYDSNSFELRKVPFEKQHNQNHMLEPNLQEELYIADGIVTHDHIKIQEDSKNQTQENGINSLKLRKVPLTKQHRDLGKAYISRTTKKPVAERKMGPECICPQKCFEKIGHENACMIFESYWAMGNHSAQTQYISSRVNVIDVKRRSVKGKVSRRSTTNIYTVHVNNSVIKVCLAAFLHIHGISEKRVRNALKVAQTRAVIEDHRGRHKPGNKTKPEVRELILAHIQNGQTYSPHYLCSKSPNQVYLPPSLSMRSLYKDYLSCLEQDNKQHLKASINTYANIFKTQFNVSLELPRTDNYFLCNSSDNELKDFYQEQNENLVEELTLQEWFHMASSTAGLEY